RREDAEGVLQDAIDKLGFTGEGYAARLTLARFLMERGEMDGARELVETVVTRDPTNGEAYTLRGRLLIIDQDYDTAVTELRRAIKESPDNVEALITLSTALNFNGNRSLAGERLGDAVEASDFAPRPSLLYADYLAQEGRLDLAGNLLADSHQRNPNARQVLVALARIKLAEGDYVAAEEAGEKLRALDDGDGRAANQIVAAALTGQERFDETLALLGTEATELENVTRSQIAGLITAYVRSGRNDEARTFLATALEQYPGNPELLRLRGRLDEVEGNIEDAEASYLAALETNSGYVPVYDALSKLMIRQGRDADAEELLVNGIENSAGNTDALRFSLAALLERRGAFSDAVYQYRLLLQRQPTSDVIANNLASIIADNDPSEEDIETAYNVAKRLRTSEIPHFQDTYGWLMHLRGDHAGALGALERAVEQLPDNPIVQYHYGAVLAALEQYERAREALDKAVELGGESALPQIERARALLAELPAESAVQ
ncbi:MAG: tetratricopeptide repeat protein, partial [Pseudomonadota bacterium]